MKLLLDTHTFIWWDSDPIRLSPNTRERTGNLVGGNYRKYRFVPFHLP